MTNYSDNLKEGVNMSKKIKHKKNPAHRGKEQKIDIEQILLKNRQLFLFGAIDEKMAYNVTQRMIALARISSEPIVLYINSSGGCVDDGFAIIDCMKGVNVPVITFIVGNACSMAGLVAIAGDKRVITEHSVIMFHDMQAGIIDYATKIEDRAEFYKREQKKLFDFIRKYTNLSEKEIQKAIHGELWLYPQECIKKGITDMIAGDKEK